MKRVRHKKEGVSVFLMNIFVAANSHARYQTNYCALMLVMYASKIAIKLKSVFAYVHCFWLCCIHRHLIHLRTVAALRSSLLPSPSEPQSICLCLPLEGCEFVLRGQSQFLRFSHIFHVDFNSWLRNFSGISAKLSLVEQDKKRKPLRLYQLDSSIFRYIFHTTSIKRWLLLF